MEISPFKLNLIIKAAAELGAISALIQAGKIKPYLKKSDAFKRYGRAQTELWLKANLITPRKDGDYSAAWRLDYLELEVLRQAIILEKELGF